MPTYLMLYPSLGPYHLARLSAASKVIPGLIGGAVAAEQSKYPWLTDRANPGFTYLPICDRPYELLDIKEKKLAVQKAISDTNPEAIMVVGYSHPEMREAARWARKNGVPCMMTTDTTAHDRSRFWPREFLKGQWVKLYYSALFLPGERSVRYYTRLGFPEERIWRGTSVVDNSFFQRQSMRARTFSDLERSRLKLPARYFLTVARLSPEKNVAGLLSAFESYRQKGGDWELVIVGSGPQEQALRRIVGKRAISGVHFAGWQQHENLPAYYGLASCFVLASLSEPWGLVVNEAMACGLPVLLSRKCGCLPELCHRGINGYDFDPTDTETLVRLMLGFSGGDFDLDSMGEASVRTISNFTPEIWALSLRDCISSVRT